MKLLCMILSVLYGANANALSCLSADSGAPLAAALEQLKGVGRLHNCEIELLSRDHPDGTRRYMLLVNDLIPGLNRPRSAVSFDFQIDSSCVSVISPETIQGHRIEYSYGYETQFTHYKVAIALQMGQRYLPQSLMIQAIDLKKNRVDQRVDCAFDPEFL